ncbi:MAG TPA: ATP-binding protein, partial [Agromyces sp.]
TARPEELAPQPGTAALPVLVERFRAAGLPVQLTTVGPPILDPNLQLTVYRIVQEGLTNALRYAATAHRVDVTVEHADGIVRVDVIDDAVVASTSELTSGGKGLVGMRERVALYGGTLEAGPGPQRGWRVHAELRDEERGTPNSDADAMNPDETEDNA